MALMRDGKEWRLSTIKDIRRARKQSEDEIMVNHSEEAKILNNEKTHENHDGQQYEYYISYSGLQRRNDRWVTEQEIRIDSEEIDRELEIHEQKEKEEKELNEQFLYNNEHLGLNEK